MQRADSESRKLTTSSQLSPFGAYKAMKDLDLWTNQGIRISKGDLLLAASETRDDGAWLLLFNKGFSSPLKVPEKVFFIGANWPPWLQPLPDEEAKALFMLLAKSKKHLLPVYYHTGAVYKSGADPEVFVLDKDGQVIPAWEFMPDKREGEVDVAYYDGFAAEFAPAARSCHEELTARFRNLLSRILVYAKDKYPSCHLSWQPVVQIPEKILATAPDQYLALGCSPSSNAYSDEPARGLQGLDPRRLPVRVAGCHIHFSGKVGGISLNELPEESIKAIVRAMDATTGIMSVSLLRGMEDPIRREYYGRAGEYRRPPHGIEWRTLSSAVLAHPALMNLMFDTARLATAIGMRDAMLLDIFLSGYSPERIQGIINETDSREAYKFIQENKAFYNAFLERRYSYAALKGAKRLIYEGAINCLDLTSMEAAWGIGPHRDNEYCPSLSQTARNVMGIEQ
jgi:hypothetical protein